MAGLWVLGGLFTFAGGWMLGTALWGWYKKRESVTWPAVQGQVIATQIREESHEEGRSFIPEVRYAYRVQGQTYTGDRLSFGLPPEFWSRHKAETFLADYPVGHPVTVFYNPEHPDDAVLERSTPDVGYYAALSLILLPLGLALLGMAFSQWLTR